MLGQEARPEISAWLQMVHPSMFNNKLFVTERPAS
jgi:hypothetical protein